MFKVGQGRISGRIFLGRLPMPHLCIPAILRQQLRMGAFLGNLAVEGHTDNIPISNRSFSSNWALSSARALTLGHKLLENPGIDPNRFKIVGYAETRPVEPNDTWSNRAKNRRVEVVITRNQTLKELDLNLSEKPAELPVQEG